MGDLKISLTFRKIKNKIYSKPSKLIIWFYSNLMSHYILFLNKPFTFLLNYFKIVPVTYEILFQTFIEMC